MSGVPFQPFGFFALVILFLMAATSHDFWLNLSAPVSKTLHMLVYTAYALLVLHVTFGVLQGEGSRSMWAQWRWGLSPCSGCISAARIERAIDHGGARHSVRAVPVSPNLGAHGETRLPRTDSWTPAPWPTFPRTAPVSSASPANAWRSSNTMGRFPPFPTCASIRTVRWVRAKILDGCITCPWHGYQYLPDTGASPPPFVEKVPTFNVRVKNGRVLIHPKPNPAGMRADRRQLRMVGADVGAHLRPNGSNRDSSPRLLQPLNDEFYIGWEDKAAPASPRPCARRWLRRSRSQCSRPSCSRWRSA